MKGKLFPQNHGPRSNLGVLPTGKWPLSYVLSLGTSKSQTSLERKVFNSEFTALKIGNSIELIKVLKFNEL